MSTPEQFLALHVIAKHEKEGGGLPVWIEDVAVSTSAVRGLVDEGLVRRIQGHEGALVVTDQGWQLVRTS